MTNRSSKRNHNLNKRFISRRDFLKLGSGLMAATVGVTFLPKMWKGPILNALAAAEAATLPIDAQIDIAATDGFVYMPGSVPGILPDPLAPDPFTIWGFGFRNVTGLTPEQVLAQKNKFQVSAPLLWVDQMKGTKVTLTNLGFQIRPDLTDGHTIHFHGFRNAIPIFDGVPEMSIAVPTGRTFPYFYHPHDPGTYMWHCHFEDVEHVSMGMTGIIFVRPLQNGNTALYPSGLYVYNDNDGSTGYDREWGLFLSEWWAREHYEGAHIQEHDWSEYEPDLWLMNGRVYPDTLEPNGGDSPLGPSGLAVDINGDLLPPPGRSDLQYQPISSLVKCNAGDRVLLRFVNLGFQQHAMTLAGITMKVVGRDATLLRGRDGTDLTHLTDTIYIGPGQSADAIFTAPSFSGGSGSSGMGYDTYLLYNRNYAYLHNPGSSGLGGQMTEVRVFAPGTLPAQAAPNV